MSPTSGSREPDSRTGSPWSRPGDLLQVPDRSTLRGKRDYVTLALLVGCALRRQAQASLEVETIQMPEGRWVLSRPGKQRETRPDGGGSDLSQVGHQHLGGWG